MTILNEDFLIRLLDNGVERHTSKSLIEILQLDEETQYFYVECVSNQSLYHLPKAITPYMMTQIRAREAVLIIANIHEAFHSIVETIYTVAVHVLKIPEESILIVSESADIVKEIKRVAEKEKRKEIKAIWSRIFERNISVHGNIVPSTNKTLEVKTYDKKYLNFNRRWRLHRPLFVALAYARGLLDKGYVSLAESDDHVGWANAWPNLLHYHDEPYNGTCPEIPELLKKNSEAIQALPPMYLDTEDLVTNRAFPTSDTDIYYRDTYFSVVSETNFYTSIKGDGFESGRFFSEKIFKPILERHPYILIAPPHSLDLLRSLGYKTFSGIIDERYDIEPNDFRRMMMILDEVERLCNLTEDQLKDFITKCKPICEYNHNHIVSKHIDKDFSNRLN